MLQKTQAILLTLLFLFLANSCVKEGELVRQTEMKPQQVSPQLQAPAGVVHQTADLVAFQPAGELGGEGNLLTPGTFFPPTGTSFAKLKRTGNYIQFNLHTTGLPPGAYTIWYVIFNDTGLCTAPTPFGECGEADLLTPKTAIVWATGKVVQANGIGNFSDRIYVGETRSETVVLGEDLTAPLEDPHGAEVHLIVKYHGAASSDPDVLYEQLHTLLGSCGPEDGANSYDAGPFGIQCFDPQFAIFPAP